jgi:hypothetical protein
MILFIKYLMQICSFEKVKIRKLQSRYLTLMKTIDPAKAVSEEKANLGEEVAPKESVPVSFQEPCLPAEQCLETLYTSPPPTGRSTEM